MKKLVFCIVALVLLTLPAAAFDNHVNGKKVFEAEKCSMCHALSNLGIEATTKSDKLKGPDLVDVSKRYEGDWLAKYLKKEADKDGKSHTKPFKGSDEELQALVDWLLEQKR